MQICVVQREGVRYFTRFKNIAEKDRLEIEVSIEGKRGRILRFDLTEELLAEYAKHKELDPPRTEEQQEQAVATEPEKKSPKKRAARPRRPRVISMKPLNTLESEEIDAETEAKPSRKTKAAKNGAKPAKAKVTAEAAETDKKKTKAVADAKTEKTTQTKSKATVKKEVAVKGSKPKAVSARIKAAASVRAGKVEAKAKIASSKTKKRAAKAAA